VSSSVCVTDLAGVTNLRDEVGDEKYFEINGVTNVTNVTNGSERHTWRRMCDQKLYFSIRVLLDDVGDTEGW
jgi:glucan phosphorylase